MESVFDIANFFVNWANKTDEEQMTNLRLNKLLYFAQGQYLARFNQPLFSDSVEAWKFGPVVPSVYKKYQVCGRNPIPITPSGDINVTFTTSERDLLLDVLREYGKYSVTALVSISHESDAPWREAYIEGRNTVISQDAMRDYFSRPKVKLPTFQSLLNTGMFTEIGWRDSDGFLVIPNDDPEDSWDEL